MNNAKLATSCGIIMRLSLLCCVSILSPSCHSINPVATSPGAIPFTVIPYGRSCMASPSVTPTSPRFEILYGDQDGSPPVEEPMFNMCPLILLLRKYFATARAMK